MSSEMRDAILIFVLAGVILWAIWLGSNFVPGGGWTPVAVLLALLLVKVFSR